MTTDDGAVAVWISPDENCMGGSVSGYWRGSVTDDRGRFVSGSGLTEEEAREDVIRNRDVQNAYYKTDPIRRLHSVATMDFPLSSDLHEAIKCIDEILSGLLKR